MNFANNRPHIIGIGCFNNWLPTVSVYSAKSAMGTALICLLIHTDLILDLWAVNPDFSGAFFSHLNTALFSRAGVGSASE